METCSWEPCLGTCFWEPCLGTCSWEPCLGILVMWGLAAPTCFETFTMVEDRKLTQLGKNADLRTWNARDSETNFVDFFSFGLCTGCHRWCTTFGCFFVLLLLPFTFSNVLKQYVNQRQCSCKRPICEMYAFVAFPHLNAVVATNGCVQVFQYGS